MINDDSLSILMQMPGYLIVKDLSLRYLIVSHLMAKHIGYRDPRDVIGITDFDVKGHLKEFANEFVERDKQSFALRQAKLQLDVNNFENNYQLFVTTKSLLYNQNKISGIITHAVPLENNILLSLGRFLVEADKKLIYKKKHFSYQFVETFEKSNLSQREIECLFYWLRGKSYQEIALLLKISTRTIEKHIENIKNKLGCKSKADLIEQSYQLGLVFVVPQRILNSLSEAR